MTLPLSPLLPETPDWQALAQECSRAYFALRRIEDAINRRDIAVDGGTFWSAHHRLEKAASTIAAWGDPELYGRLLARERMLSAMEAPTPTLCPNAANNTPHADCCEQCRNELGI